MLEESLAFMLLLILVAMVVSYTSCWCCCSLECCFLDEDEDEDSLLEALANGERAKHMAESSAVRISIFMLQQH